jgi:hypothetical protein
MHRVMSRPRVWYQCCRDPVVVSLLINSMLSNCENTRLVLVKLDATRSLMAPRNETFGEQRVSKRGVIMGEFDGHMHCSTEE